MYTYHVLSRCSRHYDVIITSPAAERQGYYDLAQQVLLCGMLYMYMYMYLLHVYIVHMYPTCICTCSIQCT